MAGRDKKDRRWIARLALLAYALALFLLTLVLSHPQDMNTPLWSFQDTRQVTAWIKELLVNAAVDFAKFIPVGVLMVWAVMGSSNRFGRFLRFCMCLALAAGLAISLLLLRTRLPGQSINLINLAPPLAGAILGRWIGIRWRQGAGARRRLLPQLALLALLAAAGAVTFLHLALQDRPLPFAPADVTSADKRYLVRLIRTKDPRSIRQGRTVSLSLTKADIDRLLAWGLSLGSPDRKARIDLDDGHAILRVSVRLNRNVARPRYLNLVVGGYIRIEAGRTDLRIDQLTMGRIGLPHAVLRVASPAVAALIRNSNSARPFLEAVRALTITPDHLQAVYTKPRLPEGFRCQVFGALGSHDELLSAVRAQVNHLLDQAPQLDGRGDKFGACLETAFRLAR